MSKKDYVILLIWNIFSKRPIVYSILISMSIYMLISIGIKNEILKIKIEEQNKKKQEYITKLKKELLPLLKQRDSLNLKINNINSCIDWITNTLNTIDYYDCNKSIIPKANAEVFKWTNIPTRDTVLMNRIPDKSPLKNNWTLFNNLKDISVEHNIPFDISLWITFAESTIGINYAKWCNSSYNNWWWIKWKIWENWERIKDQKIPDKNWCYVYRFNSIEDYWKSKMHTLQKYSSCFKMDKPITCISYDYVWKHNVAEKSWIKNVASISY